eukprot:1060502-Rhodomonas_salina.1
MSGLPDVAGKEGRRGKAAAAIDFQSADAFASQVQDFPGKFVAAVWQGLVLIQTSGDYLFSTICSSGCKLWVDGEVVVDNSEGSSAAPAGPSCDELGGVHEEGSAKCFFVPDKKASWKDAEA